MPYLERDWRSFWRDNREPENGVYGPPNSELLEYARLSLDNRVGALALDVASGDGRYAIPLAQMGFKVTAIDISKEAIDRLNERATLANPSLGIQAQEADIFDILGEKRSYDLVICSGFIEETPQPKHEELVLGLQELTNRSGINILRYVTEKKLSLDAEAEAVANHIQLQSFYRSWNIVKSEIETNFRQAKIGRELNGIIVNRFFRAATIVATKK